MKKCKYRCLTDYYFSKQRFISYIRQRCFKVYFKTVTKSFFNFICNQEDNILKYYFYQDESGHDIKLSNKESGFNFEINNQTAYFTNAFLGIPVNELDKFEKRFIELELKYKKVLGIQSDVEFKAESIKNKNFKFGL